MSVWLIVLVLGAVFTLGYQAGALTVAQRQRLLRRKWSWAGLGLNAALWSAFWPLFWIILGFRMKIR